MATEDTNGANIVLNEILNSMQDQNKAKRRKALEKFSELVFEKSEKDGDLDVDYHSKTLQFTLPTVVSCMADQSEANRINACNIILKFIECGAFTEKQLIDVIPVVHHRLANVPQIEDSEDVRLLYIEIVLALTKFFKAKMIPYMNDIVNILKETVIDASPEVRKTSCESVSAFARATKDKFHMQSESLVKPLLKGLNHQRFRNRIACMTALGDILIYGDSKVIQTIGGPLAQCSLDIPQVRLCLVNIGGTLALEMPDRYSYWHYILPLFLFALRDDDADVQNTGKDVWLKIGQQYEEENEEQLKQEIEYDVGSSHFPIEEIRPSVGCRTLVQKSLYHILPGLLTDLDDWQAGPRLQAAKLLTTLVLNAETGITQYAEKIMVALHLAAGDKEESIIKQVIICCEYLGHFLPPKTYLPLVLPRLTAGEKGERPLKILSAMMRGTPDSLLCEDVASVIDAIADEDVAHIFHVDHQSALLEVIAVLIEKCALHDKSYQVFCILLFISSSSEFPDVVNIAQEELTALGLKTELEDVDCLYKQHLNKVFKYLQQSCDSWLEHTPQFLMFLGLLEFAGAALGTELELLVDIFCACVPTKRDPVVSLKCLLILQKMLQRADCPLQSGGQLGKYLPKFMHECLAPLLPWHAGRTASSLRTAALSCFVAACQVKGIEELVKEVKQCQELLPALIEDESDDTRLIACDAVYWIKSNYSHLIDSDTLHKISHNLVGRLDDVKASVRLRAAQVLAYLFEHLPDGYDAVLQSARLQDLFESAVIYLDDPDIKLQEAVMETLQTMGKVSPEILCKLLERDSHKYRNKHHCLQLLEAMKSLSITS